VIRKKKEIMPPVRDKRPKQPVRDDRAEPKRWRPGDKR